MVSWIGKFWMDQSPACVRGRYIEPWEPALLLVCPVGSRTLCQLSADGPLTLTAHRRSSFLPLFPWCFPLHVLTCPFLKRSTSLPPAFLVWPGLWSLVPSLCPRGSLPHWPLLLLGPAELMLPEYLLTAQPNLAIKTLVGGDYKGLLSTFLHALNIFQLQLEKFQSLQSLID